MAVTSFAATRAVLESAAGLGREAWVAVIVMLAAAAALWPGSPQLPAVLTRRRVPVGQRVDHGRPADRDPGRAGRPVDGARKRSRPGARRSRWRRWGAPARAKALEGALAELVAALAAPLRSGVSPAVAIAAAAPTLRDDETLAPLLHDLSLAAEGGAPLAAVWLRHALRHDSPDLSFIGRAWALSELTGAPLADALDCAEQALRSRSRSRERLAAAAAGPRASMAVLCLLPASGPVVGWVMGVDPLTLYFSSPVATASLVVGVTLGVGAWRWSRRILRRAS